MLRFARLLRLTNTMKEFEFTRYVVPLRDRMFRYAQSLLLCADEAEDVTHDLLERLWTERGRLDGCRDIASFVMAAVRNRCYDCLRRRRADGRRNNAVAGWAERATTGDAEGWEARDLVRRASRCANRRTRWSCPAESGPEARCLPRTPERTDRPRASTPTPHLRRCRRSR